MGAVRVAPPRAGLDAALLVPRAIVIALAVLLAPVPVLEEKERSPKDRERTVLDVPFWLQRVTKSGRRGLELCGFRGQRERDVPIGPVVAVVVASVEGVRGMQREEQQPSRGARCPTAWHAGYV